MKWLTSSNKAKVMVLVQLVFIASSIFWSAFPEWERSLIFPCYFAISSFILADSRRWLALYLFLSLLSLVVHISGGTNPIWGVLQLVGHSGAFFLLFREVLRHSFFRSEVPHVDRVIAGVAGYLLLGVFWLFQFVVSLKIDEGTFVNQLSGSSLDFADVLYLSFVTLTTLGYGDLVPVTQGGKVLVLLCTLSGVLYLAVFISTLVGSRESE